MRGSMVDVFYTNWVNRRWYELAPKAGLTVQQERFRCRGWLLALSETSLVETRSALFPPANLPESHWVLESAQHDLT